MPKNALLREAWCGHHPQDVGWPPRVGGAAPPTGAPRPGKLSPMTATSAPTPMMYVECDIPEGMTLSAWRSHRHHAETTGSRRNGFARLVRRSRG